MVAGAVGSLLIVAVLGAAPDGTVEVNLGGIRQVTASLRMTEDDWLVVVRLIPVRCFDQATNAALNREKGRLFGLQALAKHLSEKTLAGITVQGASIEGSGLDGTKYELRLRVPRKGVQVVQENPKAATAKAVGGGPTLEQAAYSSTLFTRKGDYVQTLDRLPAMLQERLRQAAKEEGDAFALKVAEMEEAGDDILERLASEVKADRLLLRTEKNELNRAIKNRLGEWNDQLKQAVKAKAKADIPIRSEGGLGRFADVKIEKPFQPYLLANALLMETSGAKVIRMADGRRVVLAVASTAIKNQSADERLRAERVCRVKALAYVVADDRGVQVAHTEQVSEKTVIVLDGEKESGKSVSELLQITKTEAGGLAKDMPVVGRWRSKDGEVFYLAIGMISGPPTK